MQENVTKVSKMSIRQFLIISARVAAEALGFVFQLLYLGSSKLASWIRAQESVVPESKAESEIVVVSQALWEAGEAVVLRAPSEGGVHIRRRFYAVARGRRPGIYTSWAEANREVVAILETVIKHFRMYKTQKNSLLDSMLGECRSDQWL